MTRRIFRRRVKKICKKQPLWMRIVVFFFFFLCTYPLRRDTVPLTFKIHDHEDLYDTPTPDMGLAGLVEEPNLVRYTPHSQISEFNKQYASLLWIFFFRKHVNQQKTWYLEFLPLNSAVFFKVIDLKPLVSRIPKYVAKKAILKVFYPENFRLYPSWTTCDSQSYYLDRMSNSYNSFLLSPYSRNSLFLIPLTAARMLSPFYKPCFYHETNPCDFQFFSYTSHTIQTQLYIYFKTLGDHWIHRSAISYIFLRQYIPDLDHLSLVILNQYLYYISIIYETSRGFLILLLKKFIRNFITKPFWRTIRYLFFRLYYTKWGKFKQYYLYKPLPPIRHKFYQISHFYGKLRTKGLDDFFYENWYRYTLFQERLSGKIVNTMKILKYRAKYKVSEIRKATDKYADLMDNRIKRLKRLNYHKKESKYKLLLQKAKNRLRSDIINKKEDDIEIF